MNRRDVIKSCSMFAVGTMFNLINFEDVLASDSDKGSYKVYKKTLLVKEDGTPLKESDIQPYTAFLFFYPFKSTPCYIINTGHEVKPVEVKLKDGKSYKFAGGIGSKKSIVAYSAICPHQWSYPTKDFSLLNYYSPTEKSETTGKSGVIQCCAHISVFDPTNGGTVLEGPAEFPLAAVVLQEENGNLYAVGILGKDQFNEFFDLYKSDMIEQFGSLEKAKEELDKTVVMEVGKHVKEQIKC
ncbi:MAG: Rieske 2Fe-2S domain-containing protein [Hydrogenothermaceae bacterium]|nr:Rieske 2Fe-2S domain-containing protein [Hydrogenothermaceae bacterium]